MDPNFQRINPNHESPEFRVAVGILVAVAIPWTIYQDCRIDVPNKQMAVLIHKIGEDLEPGVVIAPSSESKGVQREVLTEGRYYYNPYAWNGRFCRRLKSPKGNWMRIRMYGDDLAAGELIAWKENQKGIVPEVLRPAVIPLTLRVDGNATRQNYAEIVELHDPVTIPAGYKGLITDLTSALPQQANEILSAKGKGAYNPRRWSLVRII